MFIGFFGAALGTTKYATKQVVGGTVGINIPDNLPQYHKNIIKNHQTLPNHTTIGEVEREKRMAEEEDAKALLLGKLKQHRLKRLKAHLQAYNHQAEYASSIADINVEVGKTDAALIKHLLKAGLSLNEERTVADVWTEQFNSNRGLFGL